MYQVKISDDPVQIRKQSFTIEDIIDEHSVCSFVVVDIGEGYSFQKGEPIEVEEDSELIFTGFIEEAHEKVLSKDGEMREHEIHCKDNHYLIDKRVIARAYENMLAGDVVKNLWEEYWQDEGIIIDNSVDDGPELEEAIFNYVSGDRALEALAEKADMWWYVDQDRILHFVERDAISGPHVTGSDMLSGTVDLEKGNPRYRNRQWVAGGESITDPQVETKPGDGDSRDFALGFRIGRVPTVEVSYNGGAFQSQTVGIRGVDEDRQWYWEKNGETITQDRDEPVLKQEDIIRIIYQGLIAVTAISHLGDEITERQMIEGVGTGKVENVVFQYELETREAALEVAFTKLARWGKISKILAFETRRKDLKAGQLITVTYPNYNLDQSELLIQSIEIYSWGEELRRRVRAVSGPMEESWVKFFGELRDIAEPRFLRENISEEDVIVLLFQWEKDDWNTESQPGNIFVTLYPEDEETPGGIYPMFDYEDRITHAEFIVDGSVSSRKQMTIRSGLDTEVIETVVYINPDEAIGELQEIHWYGGIEASAAIGSGIKIVEENNTQYLPHDKGPNESINVERIDRWEPVV